MGKKGISYTIIILVMMSMLTLQVKANNKANATNQISLYPTTEKALEKLIKKNMEEGYIPGLAVVIIKDGQVAYKNGFGYADIKRKEKVTSKTLFEIGSNSKAFTALGILNLEKEGKIQLDDSVTKYIPWFKMRFVGRYQGEQKDEYVDITIKQLLHHTSGIPTKSIGDIPVSNDKDALKKTVKTQVNKRLTHYPGEVFEYATINYDILGLIIQNITSMSYENYMKEHILSPLGLHATYTHRNNFIEKDMATGYKIQYLKARPYDAPIYKGNTPAGYLISNINDMEQWINIQLGVDTLKDFDSELIKTSHIPDRTVSPSRDGSSYAYGWSVYQEGEGVYTHAGNNPNYSSYILLRPDESLGICILANINSAYTMDLGKSIYRILHKEEPINYTKDMYSILDSQACMVMFIGVVMLLIILLLFARFVLELLRKKRSSIIKGEKIMITIIGALLITVIISYCLYRIPYVLFYELPWHFIKVWASQSIVIAIRLLIIVVVLFNIYFVLERIYPKRNDKTLFTISILSIVSGLGNSLIIFSINETLNRDRNFQSNLLLFFLLGILLYVFNQRIVRGLLLKITNNLVYHKRIELTSIMLKASYEKIEQLETGRTHATLNNDTEVISNFANMIITAITSIVTLLCCFIYLGVINPLGLVISIAVILMAAGLYFLVGRYANKLWEETRSIQNRFFKFVDSLSYGFKELKMSWYKQKDFVKDMENSCKEYRDKRITGDLGFANAFVIGELLFTIVIGVVAFAFPIIFRNISNVSLRSYIFVFLYMTGPVHSVLNIIPQMVRVRISYKRLNNLVKELKNLSHETVDQPVGLDEQAIHLQLKDVEYQYKNQKDHTFHIGPINYAFKSSEISFITGGNGSGKSTLAKVLTGLYEPDKGQILLNNRSISSENIRELYTTVFSDYYLFDKLYGIEQEDKTGDIEKLLKLLHLKDKVKVEQGSLSTLKLSSGQRKRLALLISYLEDKPIYLFDEWAAEQDPIFRQFFYEALLPELKKKGKCIIAITHDERYFHVADHIIKMELGKITT